MIWVVSSPNTKGGALEHDGLSSKRVSYVRICKLPKLTLFSFFGLIFLEEVDFIAIPCTPMLSGV